MAFVYPPVNAINVVKVVAVEFRHGIGLFEVNQADGASRFVGVNCGIVAVSLECLSNLLYLGGRHHLLAICLPDVYD